MYKINHLARPTLITPDEVLFHAATDHTVDARQILQNIIVAEERIIAPALTDAFYEELILMKNKTVDADNQADILAAVNASLTAAGMQAIAPSQLPAGTLVNAIEFVTVPEYRMLWDRFLWKLTAEAVDMMCIVPSWLRHTSQGQQKNNPEVIGGNGQNSASGDRKDVQFKLDTWMQDRIDPLIERMRFWIGGKRKLNNKVFPNYGKDVSDITGISANDGVSVLRKTDWVFNAYETPPKGGCKMDWIEWE